MTHPSLARKRIYLGSANLTGDLGVNLLKEFIRPHFVFGNINKRSDVKDDEKKGN
jgi:hypothetical protein